MTGFEIAAFACAAVALIAAVLLGVIAAKLTARIKDLSADQAGLEAKFEALRDQNQRELLAIGQRVLEADKIVRRFSERLDGIENNHTAEQPQYGQLQNLLKQASALGGEASAAELELMSLLRRQQRG